MTGTSLFFYIVQIFSNFYQIIKIGLDRSLQDLTHHYKLMGDVNLMLAEDFHQMLSAMHKLVVKELKARVKASFIP